LPHESDPDGASYKFVEIAVYIATPDCGCPLDGHGIAQLFAEVCE
jgi:hypothetical protein